MSMGSAARNEHTYETRVEWTGNLGTGTASYTGYDRDHMIRVDGKPGLAGSSDPMFRGNPHRHNPEDLFIAALSACHMLMYLALCARNGICVLAYEDVARGTMVLRADGGGAFTEVTLAPVVTIAAGGDEARALQLHEQAHALCFIANSCSAPVRHQPTVRIAGAVEAEQGSGAA